MFLFVIVSGCLFMVCMCWGWGRLMPRPGCECQRKALGVGSLFSPRVPEFNINHQAFARDGC